MAQAMLRRPAGIAAEVMGVDTIALSMASLGPITAYLIFHWMYTRRIARRWGAPRPCGVATPPRPKYEPAAVLALRGAHGRRLIEQAVAAGLAQHIAVGVGMPK